MSTTPTGDFLNILVNRFPNNTQAMSSEVAFFRVKSHFTGGLNPAEQHREPQPGGLGTSTDFVETSVIAGCFVFTGSFALNK